MTISQFIAHLEDYKKEIGDIECRVSDGFWVFEVPLMEVHHFPPDLLSLKAIRFGTKTDPIKLGKTPVLVVTA